MAIPAPINPERTIIAPAFLDAKKTPAKIRIPVIGELNNGTSEMPLNRVKKKSNAGFPVEKFAGPTIKFHFNEVFFNNL
jgi:hypothetical protein